MNYQKILNNGINSLKISNIINPELDSELLLSKALNKKREKILTNLTKEINKKQVDKFNLYLSRRKKREPIAYILGFKYFWKYKFFINKSVLVPRPETEQIVEETLNYLSDNESKKILDIGTGSGCIIVSVLKERSKCKAIAIDISSKALKVAKTNAKIHHLENKIKFINIDIDKFNYNKYDLILSNPPYISNIDLVRLDDDIRIYEPRESLSGGLDGYEEITKVIEKSSKLLKNNGKLIVEIGETQKNNVIKLLKNNGFYINKTGKDLSGRDRCIVSTKINNK
jgi:release factor glutamine methyltransferase